MVHARSPFFLLLLPVALVLAGCRTVGSGGQAHNPELPVSASTAVLRPGDSLTVALLGIPDASTNNVQIDEQGLISLPFIGPVQAEGSSSSELSRQIQSIYLDRRFYTSIDVSVSVTERYVYVGGEVGRPGRIIWTPDLTVSKAIQAAGGFSLFAREGAVSVTREDKAYTIDVNLAQRNPAEDRRLLPGDSIQVPRSAF